jgi:hypothetical protein
MRQSRAGRAMDFFGRPHNKKLKTYHIPRPTSLAGMFSQQGVPDAGGAQSDMSLLLLVETRTFLKALAKCVCGW